MEAPQSASDPKALLAPCYQQFELLQKPQKLLHTTACMGMVLGVVLNFQIRHNWRFPWVSIPEL